MVKNFTNNKTKLFVFFIITLLFKPLWLFNNNNLGNPGDDMSYWLHSATLAFDQDLDYTNDYGIESSIFNPITNVPSHPPGAGYLSSPFVFLFSQLDKIIDRPIENTRTNPVKSFGYIGFFVAGLFYTYYGTKLISKLVKKYNNNFSSLLIFCGFISSLVHFVSTRFLMSHAVEFFLCCMLIYIFENNENEYFETIDITKLFLTYFCLAITRPSTFLYSLILIVYYKRKFVFNGKNVIVIIAQLFGFSTFYIFLSRLLYQKNYIFLNTYGSQAEEYFTTLNFEQLFNGFLKLPNLFFSPNMGIVYSTPIIFITLIVFLTKFLTDNMNISDKFIMFLYFGFSFVPLLIWQGREVAYGQRLLIGIVPICILFTCKYVVEKPLKSLSKFLTLFSLFGYFFFYSSERLTLRTGTTLWGTQVSYTSENYYVEVLKAILDIETILSASLRNIYSVDIFKFINLRNYINNPSLLDSFSIEKMEKFLSYTDQYYNLDTIYLVVVNIVIFLFSYFYTKLIFDLRK